MTAIRDTAIRGIVIHVTAICDSIFEVVCYNDGEPVDAQREVRFVDNRVLRILEYKHIIEKLKTYTASSLGKEKVEELQPSYDLKWVLNEQQATLEAFNIYRLKGDVPFGGIRDIRPWVKRAQIGGMLQASDLVDVADLLYGGRQLKQFLHPIFEEQELPTIQQWAQQITDVRELEREIRSCIDDHGQVMDSASSALRTSRAQIRSAEARIKQQLDRLTRSSSVKTMLQDPIVTIRNDRYCLPVKSDYRNQFGGMVHDQSSSGATLFIEPKEVVQINNELKEAKLREEKEVEKILRQLTANVAEETDPLLINVNALKELDFVFAKARFAKELKAIQPKINDQGYFHLKNARHPFIEAEEIVPVSFELGAAFTSLVITGPNTGGKTVTLKTLGLLTLMACSGLFIPAEEGSEMAVVSGVYADIGDEQSIEQNLSTFSGHMTNIIRILEAIDEQSLILLDELGAGTDPGEGAALAMAILDNIHQKGARVAATTHFSELKAYAYSQEGVQNASMEFDLQTLQPTYRLLVGIPGKSNAFAIARRLGLSDHVIEQAQSRMSAEETRVDSMISSLEENQRQTEHEVAEARRIRRETEQLREKLARNQEQLERDKQQAMERAQLEANEYVLKMKEEAEEIIRDLRSRSDGLGHIKDHELIDARKKLDEASEQTRERKVAHGSRTSGASKGKVAFQPGDQVYVHSFGQKGYIVEKVQGREYLVQLGIMKMKVPYDQMEIVQQKQPVFQPTMSVQTSQETVRTELDIRGQTVDEAVMKVDKYLDDALISGYHQVSIIHGKGTGQLRKGIHEFLKGHGRIKTFRLGESGEGGSGVSVVQFC